MTTTDALESLLEALAAATDGPRSLAVLEVVLKEGEESPSHVHEAPELMRVLEGRLHVTTRDESLALGPGSIYTAPAGVAHAVAARDGDVRFVVASVTPEIEGYVRFQRAVTLAVDVVMSDDDAALVGGLAAAAGITLHAEPGSASARI